MRANSLQKNYDVVIIGAGAAGLMCAIRAGERGLSVLVLDKADRAGKKILISGGGRCNFTNYNVNPSAYISPNPHFCKSALSRYTQWHFIELLEKYHLTYTEKTLGQLFCEQKSSAIVEMLVDEATSNGVTIVCNSEITDVSYERKMYQLETEQGIFTAPQLVIACGGPSFPKVSGSDFALRLAKQFKIKNNPFIPALVPLILPQLLLSQCKELAGVSTFVEVSCNGMSFSENILFTHRGLSGPAILQISSYWKKGDTISIDFSPQQSLEELLLTAKKQHPNQLLVTTLAELLPKKLAENLLHWFTNEDSPKMLKHYSEKELQQFAQQLHNWQVVPSGSEGMKKAEVSTGGIDPDGVSSKTFECKQQKGLYVIGEALDVTGWLGGYNFQWAWSSGWCCGDSLEK